MTDPDDNMALSASITETYVPTNKIPRQATFPKNQPLTMKSPPYKPTVDILERDHLPQDKSNTDTLPNKTLTTPMQLPRQATKPHANQANPRVTISASATMNPYNIHVSLPSPMQRKPTHLFPFPSPVALIP